MCQAPVRLSGPREDRVGASAWLTGGPQVPQLLALEQVGLRPDSTCRCLGGSVLQLVVVYYK